jgi:hypothetical protein
MSNLESTASEADVVEGRVVVVTEASVERLDAGLHTADAVEALATFLAPISARVSRPVDFVSVGAHEADVVGRRPVRTTAAAGRRRADSQNEFRQITAKRASDNLLEISRTNKFELEFEFKISQIDLK